MDWIDSARKRRELEGLPKYGKVSPKEDPRCFRREMVEELLDALNYTQWSLEKGEIPIYKHRVIESDLRRLIKLFIPCMRHAGLIRKLQEGLNVAKRTSDEA